MPDYGLKIKTPSGEIQIDSTYRNLSLAQSGSGTVIVNNNTTTDFYTRIPITASPLIPLFLIKPNTDNFVSVRNYHKIVISPPYEPYEFDPDFRGVDIVTMHSQTTSIAWECYRENITPGDSIYALRVYNSSGQLCFDSSKKYFKILSISTFSLAAPNNPNVDLGDYVDISHPSINNPYYILSPGSFWNAWLPIPNRMATSMIGFKQLTATSVRVGWFAIHAVPSDAYDTQSGGNNPTMKLIVCTP